MLINGAELATSDEGEGIPLVLVHGSAADLRTWKSQQGPFSTRYRVVTYSRRYHRPNAPIPPDADYSMPEHAADLTALLEAVDDGPAHVVGHSYGAFVALLVAIQSPHLVRSLVLAEAPVVTLFISDPPRPAELLKLVATRPATAGSLVRFAATGLNPARKAAKRGDLEGAIARFGPAVLGVDAFRDLAPERLQQVYDNTTAAEFLGSGFVPVADEAVAGVTAPTLLVTGSRSPRLWDHVADRLEALLPNVERIEIAGASHMMHEDDAPAFNAAVLEFLARHDGVR